jgi:hypothetical protein
VADALEFDFTAQISDLLTGLQGAQDALSETLGQMSVQIDEVSNKLDTVLPQAAQHAASSLKEVDSASMNMGESLKKVSSILETGLEATGILAVVEGVKKAAEEIKKFGDESQQLITTADILQINTDQLQGYQAAAEGAGVGNEQFTRGMERLMILLNQAQQDTPEAVAKFRDMGLTLEQIHDPATNIAVLMQILHDKLLDAGTAAATHAKLQEELGLRSAAVVKVLEDFSFKAADVKEKIDALHSPTQAQITTMALWGTAIGETAKEYGNFAKRAVADSETALEAVSRWFGQLKGIAGEVKELYTGVAATPTAAPAGGSGAGAQQEQMEEVVATQKKITEQTLASEAVQVEAAREGTTQRVALANTLYEDTVAFYGKTSVESQKAYEEMTRAATAYTENVLKAQEKLRQLVSAGKMKELQENMRLNEQELTDDLDRIAKQEAAADTAVKTTLQIQLAGLQRGQKAIEDAYQQHKITNQQELQDTIANAQAQLEARMAAYQKMETIYAAEPEMMRKIYADESKAQSDYLAALSAAQQKYSQQQSKQWTGLINSMTSTFASGITKMIEGQETFRKFTQTVFSSLFSSLISMMVKWVAQWIEQQIVGMLASKVTATSQIAANAAIAGSGAMASVAMIPYVGWAMAPEVGAAVYGEALGYTANVAAAGGYDVPSGINPVAQLHQDEMVLPAHLADAVRDMAGGRGGGGGQTHNYNGSMNFNGVSDDWLKKQLTSPRGRATLFKAAGQAIGRGVRVR